jgi:hypothetical protein
MEHEDGKWWMYGVCPGAVAGSGDTPNEAFIDFRNRYKEALFDLAAECTSFLIFRNAVKSFFEAEDTQEKARWESSLEILRKNEEAVCEPFKKMPRKKPGDYEVGIRIDRLENKPKAQLKPANNVQDSLAKAA